MDAVVVAVVVEAEVGVAAAVVAVEEARAAEVAVRVAMERKITRLVSLPSLPPASNSCA